MSATKGAHHCAPHQRKFVLFVAILASALGFIDGSVVAIAIPQIRESLNASFGQVQWISNAYMLFLSALMLLGGAAGDRFGIRKSFGVGIVLFVVASVLCAFATSAPLLIAARVIQGAGAAIMVPGSMALIARNFPKEERGKAMGIWVAASAIATAFGPLIGGVVLNWGDANVWRWIFLINLPLGLLTLFILVRKVPDDLPAAGRALDVPGAVLATLSMGALALGLTLMGDGETGLQSWLLMVAALVVGFGFLIWERRTPAPMIDLQLFKAPSFSGANVLTFLVWVGLGAVFFFLPMVIITGWQLTELHAGGIFIPLAILIASISPIAGRMVDRMGTRVFLTLGPLLAAAAYALLAFGILRQDYWLGVLPAIFVLGCAMGITASPLSSAVMQAVDDDRAGMASGINNMVARLSNLFAVAGLGAALSYIYASVVRDSPLHADIQNLMIEKGFGERLTGPLYQISTVELQNQGMNIAFAGLCSILVISCLLGALVGWFTQPSNK